MAAVTDIPSGRPHAAPLAVSTKSVGRPLSRLGRGGNEGSISQLEIHCGFQKISGDQDVPDATNAMDLPKTKRQLWMEDDYVMSV